MKMKEILLGLLHSRKYYEEEVRKARENYMNQLKLLREGKIYLRKGPTPGITGELKGESNKRGNKRGNKC